VLISPEKELWHIKNVAASNRPRVGPSLCIDQELNLYLCPFNPYKKAARKTSSARLFSNCASNVGVAFLSAQITDLETVRSRCAFDQSRRRGATQPA